MDKKKLAKLIWEVSRRDESTISATGAEKIADAIIASQSETLSLNEYAKKIHEIAVDHGWWDKDRNFGEMVALMHSELSEGLEARREQYSPLWYDHHRNCGFSFTVSDSCTCTPKPEGWAVELIDCIIRILDTLHQAGIDIDKITQEKMKYNETRPYKHGKAY